MPRSLRLSLLAGTASLLAVPVAAQTSPAPTSDPAVAPAPQGADAGAKRVYTPADFARFAPKTAYDMLVQVPSFTIRVPDPTERGLGQASENVLINGERINNKNYTGGVGGAVDQLQRTPAATVERIEIINAASLGIAGLSGEVANVILKSVTRSTGQIEWDPTLRAHYAKPELYGGLISYSSKAGPVSYTLSVENQAGRGAFGGPILIYDQDHNLTESRREIYHSEYDAPVFQGKFALDGPGSSVGNLTLSYTPYWNPAYQADDRVAITGVTSHRLITTTQNGYLGDINGDYEFALGPGRLKLIGLRHWQHDPAMSTLVMSYDDGQPDTGSRFTNDTHSSETIDRGEYHWKTGKNDWQVTFERAFNSLDQKGGYFLLDPSGDFVEQPFPDGSGKVTEVRYEGLATLSRPLTSKLDLQAAAGAEVSRLDLVNDDQPARRFFRPKGSIDLGWHPSKGWDLSLKLRRRVGQIDFSDFISQEHLSSDREDAGNPNLVPPQSWEVETEVGRDLGRWGKTRLNLHYYRVQDIIDVIPIGEDGQGIGNLPRADRFGFESKSTLLFDPVGWKGAKLDFTIGAEKTSVRDPLTHEKREITGVRDRWLDAQLRDDIPGTQIAWGAYAQYNHYARYYYLTEVFSSQDLPWITGFYVEDKNVYGATVRFTVDNVLNGRHLVDRAVYAGFRDRAPVSFFERHDELVGPLFSLTVKRSF
ncbi:TonB-dependent receptor plug domain-containing protein [Sphingomonas sp.]|uniref:TonB-dependent receptor plug domain-containing protein n=1 Tax=Sphingomonas sp. TaxID=28214 RepID=UPI0025DE1D2D|nr:TonB-dependent receptor plug domain-containing protein [Sphingomonas sp.]MBV9528022.1 TonB-dependent receptor plug domain-containing protein [Sphingomonas sp.]